MSLLLLPCRASTSRISPLCAVCGCDAIISVQFEQVLRSQALALKSLRCAGVVNEPSFRNERFWGKEILKQHK